MLATSLGTASFIWSININFKIGSIINVGVTSRKNEKHKRKPTE